MSLLNSTLKTVVVKLKDMSGNVSNQKLHNRIFDAYEAKSLVFENGRSFKRATICSSRGVRICPSDDPFRAMICIPRVEALKRSLRKSRYSMALHVPALVAPSQAIGATL